MLCCSSAAALALLAAITVTWPIAVTIAGLPLPDDDYRISNFKRNTWWSKKSTPTESMDMVVGCYTAHCITSFIACVKQSTSQDTFLRCKLEHHSCTERCFQTVRDEHDLPFSSTADNQWSTSK